MPPTIKRKVVPTIKDRMALCITNNHHMMPDDFFWSYLHMLKPNGSIAVKGACSIKASSICSGIFEGLNFGAEWFFLMDVDQLFPRTTIPSLLASAKKYDAKVISALYHLGKAPYGPVAGWDKLDEDGKPIYVNSKGGHWKYEYAPVGSGVVEVDWVGAGSLLFHVDVIKAIGWPAFKDIWEDDKAIRISGHDVNFCSRAKQEGFKIYVDTAVTSDHGKFTYFGDIYAKAFNESNIVEKMGGVIQRQSHEVPYWDTVWRDEVLRESKARMKYVKETTDQVVALVPEKSRVADVGSGPGSLLELVASRTCQCDGYDFSDVAIDSLKQKRFGAHKVDFRNFSFNGDKNLYDVVISTHTIEHLHDDRKFLGILNDLCKKDGLVIVVTPWQEDVQGCFEHVHQYTEEELRKLIGSQFKEFEIKKNNRDYVITAKAV